MVIGTGLMKLGTEPVPVRTRSLRSIGPLPVATTSLPTSLSVTTYPASAGDEIGPEPSSSAAPSVAPAIRFRNVMLFPPNDLIDGGNRHRMHLGIFPHSRG